MPHKKVQDIIPRGRNLNPTSSRGREVLERANRSKSVHRIPAPLPRAKRTPRKKITRKKKSFFEEVLGGGNRGHDSLSILKNNKSNRPRFILWIIASFSIIFLIISLSTIFENATLKIVPQQTTMDLDFVFTAEKEASGQKIPFEVMTLSGVESTTIPATDVRHVERRASGRIVIYNDFNTYTQRLVKNTRFETPDGLIYRIRESVTIPGQHTKEGKELPGALEVTVYADLPGEKYNIDLVDFTIPGFKGTRRYNGFYARSKTEMTGGFSGVVKVVSEEELKKTKEDLRQKLTKKLLESIHAQKPENFILFNGATVIVFGDDEQGEEKDTDKTTVDIKQTAKLYGIIFNKDILSQRLAEKRISQLDDNDSIIIINLEDLEFSLVDKDKFNPLEDEIINFSLKGNPTFVWKFDAEKLKEAIAGLPKDKLKEVLIDFPSITRAEVIIRPFWKRSFPENIEDFIIETIIE